jgi:hypothetical protein
MSSRSVRNLAIRSFSCVFCAKPETQALQQRKRPQRPRRKALRPAGCLAAPLPACAKCPTPSHNDTVSPGSTTAAASAGSFANHTTKGQRP